MKFPEVVRRTRAVTVCLVACCTTSTLDARTTNKPGSAITEARRNYTRIERNLKNYRRVQAELMGYSTEGGELVGYFKAHQPRKLVATYYGETGKTIEEYYFWGNRLFFVLHTSKRYNHPIGYDMPSGPMKVVKTEQERFYFQNGQLIRWIDPGNKTQRIDDNRAKQQESDVLNDARQLLARSRMALTNPER